MKPIHDNRKVLESKRRKRVFTHGTKQRFHFESLRGVGAILNLALKATFVKKIGLRNAKNIALNEVELKVKDLPKRFDGCKILFVTDVHIEGIDCLADRIISIVKQLEYDYCLLGGDYTFRYPGSDEVTRQKLRDVVGFLKEKSRVFGILGNHDEYRIAENLSEFGVEMLLNENVRLERDGDSVYLVGVDDCHLYAAAELEDAEQGIPDGVFKIVLSHSPELYKEAAQARYSLYLAGHTHGGQICLPNGFPVVVCAPIPRKMAGGVWRHGDMAGYTSRGAGTSVVSMRFFCSPEVALLTLRTECNAGEG